MNRQRRHAASERRDDGTIEGVRTCIVSAEFINNRTRPLLMTVNEQVIPFAETA